MVKLSSRAILALCLVGCAQVVDAPERQYDPTYQGSSAGTTGTPEPTTKDELCNLYCLKAFSVCTGDLSIYPSINACKATCLALPTGEPTNLNTNSVHCRLNHLDLASKNEDTARKFCPPAGPGGGPANPNAEGEQSACGTDCEGFCYLTDRVCTGKFQVYAPGACLAACQNMARRGPYSSELDQTGDTIGCRLYHISAAADSPGGHCDHVKGDKNCNQNDIKLPAP